MGMVRTFARGDADLPDQRFLGGLRSCDDISELQVLGKKKLVPCAIGFNRFSFILAIQGILLDVFTNQLMYYFLSSFAGFAADGHYDPRTGIDMLKEIRLPVPSPCLKKWDVTNFRRHYLLVAGMACGQLAR